VNNWNHFHCAFIHYANSTMRHIIIVSLIL